VSNPDQFWQMLSEGRDGIRQVPRERWDWRRYYSEDPEAPGKIYVRHGGFLTHDIESFDAGFFGISPREAMTMDPQQRLLLETSWEAIEDAGVPVERLAGSRTGVYIGAFTLDNMLTQMAPGNRRAIGSHTAVSSTMTILSNRLSYAFDLRGPSLSVDTACSSSIVAFHLACQAMWNGECDMALVGGVNVIFRPEYMVAMCKGQFLSKDGRSKSFDQRADGYGRGEGAGVILVKPLEAAQGDGDRIYALVRGTGCNQDGRTNGITVPNGEAQKELMLSVARQSGVAPRRIRYVEAHGTGTPIGDPIEARAIGETLGRERADGERLLVGSVKANIGHLEAASGVAGLIKLCLCYRHGAIPPVANLAEPNSAIPFDELRLRLPSTLEALPGESEPTFFAINSFGYGGTNAHAILESPPVSAPLPRSTRAAGATACGVLPVSARSEAALRQLVSLHRDALRRRDSDWLDFCAAAALHRSHHEFRVSFAGVDVERLLAQMDEWLSSGAPAARVSRAGAPAAGPVLVFSGMGPQWWGMGQQLLERDAVFREFAERADAAFRAVSGWSIVDEMRRDKDSSRIRQTVYAQPANFVLQAGLFEWLKSRGVHPAAVIGHSVGEMSSAYAAGVLSLEDAVRVSYHRSQIQAKAAGLGGMLAAGLSESEALALIAPYGDGVAIAAVNGPRAVTLAGEARALSEIASRLAVKSLFHRMLQVEVAYHSAFMEPLKQPLVEALADLRPRAPALPLYSTVTGLAVADVAYDAPYWARNIREPVQFMRALQAAVADGHRLFLEVGPHPVLAGSVRECFTQAKVDGHVVSTLVRETDERQALLRSLGELYSAGCAIDWEAVNGRPSQHVDLPSYPWQRERYWGESEAALHDRVGRPVASFAGHRLDTHEQVWERTVNDKYLPYIDEHVVDGVVLLPGAAFVDAALGLQREVDNGAAPLAVENVSFKRPLVVDRGGDVVLRTAFDNQSRTVVFHGRPESAGTAWTRHGEARLSRKRTKQPAAFDIAGLQARLGEAQDVSALYVRLARIGLEYGAHFRRIAEIRAQGDEILSRLTMDGVAERSDIEHVLHPLLLDGAFQSLLAALDGDGDNAFVPVSIDRVAVFQDVPEEIWCYGRITSRGDDAVAGDLWLLDRSGRALAAVTAVRCAKVARIRNSLPAAVERCLVQPAWHPAALERTRERGGTWLFLAEGGFPDGSFAAQLAQELRREGCERLITIGVDLEGSERSARAPGDVVSLDFVHDLDGWSGLFREFPPQSLAGIAYIAWDVAGDAADVSIARAAQLLSLFKHLPPDSVGLRAYLVTEQAQAVTASDPVLGWAQGSAVGFFRVAHNEFPGLRCTMVDHDGRPGVAGDVIAELLGDDGCDDVAWRDGVRYTQRLQPRTLLDLEKDRLTRCAVAGVSRGFVLARTESGVEATGDGGRDLLYWRQDPAPALAADELEIEVAYCAIDEQGERRDLAHRLTIPAWREFSGRISRVGTAVGSWRVGDGIAAAAFCRLASHVVARESTLRAVRLDAAPSAESASLAMTAAAVDVALRQMALAKREETVLVVQGKDDGVAPRFVAAASALGLRVLSAHCGAEPSSTAGSDTGLDLHDEGFAHDVLAANGGRPVDVTVFCDAVNPSLHNRIPLAFGGRVVLYGRANESVEVGRFVDPATMHALYRVDSTALAATNLAPYRAALDAVAASSPGSAVPAADDLCPAEELPARAFGEQGGGRRRVVDMRALPRIVPADTVATSIDPEAAYLITGGYGGFGMGVATELIAQGARHIVLIGRSGATTDRAREQLGRWRQQGVTVREALIDIGVPQAVDALYADVSAARPVKGVFHAAGVLEDTIIRDMTREQLVAVMRPKVRGAWNLHFSSLRYGSPLDHFVLFSSASSIIGNSRQANYVAANAVLDALAAHRNASGLAGCSINWGALGEVGMAADNEALLRHFELMGMNPLRLAQAMYGLGAALRYRPAQLGIMDVNWVQWGKFEPAGGKSPRFAHLTGRLGGAAHDTLAGTLQKLPAAERCALVDLMLAEQVAHTLRLPAARIDVKRALTDMGIDSLMAVELQMAINAAFGVEFSALELLRGFCISELTPLIMERMGLAADMPASGSGAVPTDGAEPDPDQMTEAELDAIIAAAN
jgi:acyl transferase domain-containing protein/acyl carrier protein